MQRHNFYSLSTCREENGIDGVISSRARSLVVVLKNSVNPYPYCGLSAANLTLQFLKFKQNMAVPKFNVVIPYQYYNLVLVFVTILVLLWGMVAIKRVYRMLRIRSAVLSDRLINIRGLGSYLTYFDGATRSHMDAVVHTRQSMPPVAMEQLNVTSVIKDIEISSDGQGDYFLKVNAVSSVSSRVIVLFDFNVRNLQQLMVQARTDSTGTYLSDSRIFTAITGLKPAQHRLNSVMFPHFQRNEVCSFECLSEDVGPGERSLRMPLPATVSSFFRDKVAQPSTADATSKLVVAVMILPTAISSSRAVSNHANRSHHASSPSSRKSNSRVGVANDDKDEDEDGRRQQHGGDDLEAAEDELLQAHEGDTDKDDASVQSSSDSGTGRNPLVKGKKGNNNNSYANVTAEPAEDGSSPGGHVVQSVLAGIFVHNVHLPALRSSRADGSSSSSTAPSELIVLDRQLNVYSSLEVFGLAAATSATSSSSSSSSSSSTSSSSGTSSSLAVQDRPAERATPNDAFATNAEAAAPKQQQQEAVAAAAVCCGGSFIAEDCVVCLTDHKEVLLLPCRYDTLNNNTFQPYFFC